MNFKFIFNNKGLLGIEGGYKSSKDSYSKSYSNRTENAPSEFIKQEEYPEAEGARKAWWQRLQEFGGQPGYGAISPDWGDIWQNAQRKVQQYFWGSPTQPGAVSKIQASAARRNRSDDPALQNMMARMAATEGGLLSDMATEQATEKSKLAESGRLNWLTNLMSLSGMQMPGQWFTPWTTTSGTESGTGKQSGWNVSGEAGKDSGKSFLDSIFG
jgi:hypothetical protein